MYDNIDGQRGSVTPLKKKSQSAASAKTKVF